MDIIIGIATFILGFVAEKILDKCTILLGRKISKKRKEGKLVCFLNEPHEDVLITASSFPFYKPDSVVVTLNREMVFRLAPPGGAKAVDFSKKNQAPEVFCNFIKNNDLQEKLEETKLAVYESFQQRTNGNHFNGKILGVNHLDGFSRTTDSKESPLLSIVFFETDYYTHKVIEKLISEWQREWDPLNSTYSWTRTSFGVSVILILPKQNEIILTRRAATSAYTAGKSWIYVSVTETVSETDYNEEKGNPDLVKCVYRGVNEELGITEWQLKTDTLHFYDAFYETHFHQDNVVASIEISEDLTFSDIYHLLAKDKFLETTDLITIDNDKRAITDYIKNHRNEMRSQTIFSLESFAARK